MSDMTFIPGKWYAFTGCHTGARPEGAPGFVARYRGFSPVYSTTQVFESTMTPTADRHLKPYLTRDGSPINFFLRPSEADKFKIQLLEDVEGVPVQIR